VPVLNDGTSIKEILENTVIEEHTAKPTRDKKELTVFDFMMNYQQGSMFELKATKVSKSREVPETSPC
jgi:hypothetical protein